MIRRTTNRLVLLPALSLFFAVGVPAGEPPTAPPDPAKTSARRGPADEIWLRITTPNFTVFGDVAEPRLRAIATRLEAFRGALESLHPGARTSPRETCVYVFKDAKSGWPFSPAPVAGDHHLGVAPAYDVGNYVTVAAPADDPPLGILYHAYAHQFLDDNFPRLPLAITEGLAEFYSGFSVESVGTLIGLVNSDHVRRMREGAMLPLSEQLTLRQSAPLLATTNGREIFVAESWALMHYLVSGSGEKRTRLPAFLEVLQHFTPPDLAAQHALGVTLDQLQQEVAQYVGGNRFLPIRIADGTRAAPAPLDLHRMSRDEILAALGDVLGHTATDRAASESYFQEALRSNPDQARAYAGLGYLRYSQNQLDEAIHFFKRAIAIEPDAMSCYLLARSLLKTRGGSSEAGATPAPVPVPAAPTVPAQASAPATPPWLEWARHLLAQAIALRPGFAAPYVTLGATHTLPDGDVAAGIDLLQKARRMLPARTDIAGNLVYLYLRQGDAARARQLVDTALAGGGDEETLNKARAAIATFEDNVRAKQSLAMTRPAPEDAARAKAWNDAMTKTLREDLARTTDPEARAKIEAALKHLEENPDTSLDYYSAVSTFNEAVDKANRRDYAAAIALLEGLLPKVQNDGEFRERIKTLLERFRKDADRLQHPEN